MKSVRFFSSIILLPLIPYSPIYSLAAEVDVSAAENVKPALPKIPRHTFSLADFGGVGDGKTLNSEAFGKAIAAVSKAGGGTLIVPSGTFRTLPFALCSN